MIDAKDLRIGNWVIYNAGFGKQMKIEKGEWLDFPQYYEPIPITHEILEKCGFLKLPSCYEEAETTDFYLRPLYFDMANSSIKINGVYQQISFPEYLHDLQNLYFALTGEELNYKP